MFFSSRGRGRAASQICRMTDAAARKTLFGHIVDQEIAAQRLRQDQELAQLRRQEAAIRHAARNRATEPVDLLPTSPQKPFDFKDVIRKEDTKLFDFPVAPTNRERK